MRATGTLLLLASLLLLLAALPDLLQRLEPHGAARLPDPDGSAADERGGAEPDPGLRPQALLANGLLERLSDADRAWIPRAEPLPQGGVRYLYKRRPDQPELTIAQIQAAIAHPPRHDAEQRAIVELLASLEQVGVSLDLSEPIKPGAAAEWDPRARMLRIRPDVIDQGSLEFARVLNHEAVHVAQSCLAGSLGASPRPLGIRLPAEVENGDPATGLRPDVALARTHSAVIRQLNDPVYAGLSAPERRMEAEAYSLQNSLDSGRQLIGRHCRTAGSA